MYKVADEYRRNAEGCRRLADPSAEMDRKSHWIEQAAEWDRRSAEALSQSRRKHRGVASLQTAAIRRQLMNSEVYHSRFLESPHVKLP
jgi:hypothetical protein